MNSRGERYNVESIVPGTSSVHMPLRLPRLPESLMFGGQRILTRNYFASTYSSVRWGHLRERYSVVSPTTRCALSNAPCIHPFRMLV